MTQPQGPGTIRALVQALGDPGVRESMADALARATGAQQMLLLVRDARSGAYVPAPGMKKTLRGGLALQAFVKELPEGQWTQAQLALSPGDPVQAAGLRQQGCAVVLLGAAAEDSLPALAAELPLLCALLRTEYELRLKSAEADVAESATRRAHALASSVDAARATAMELAGRLELEHRRKDEFIAMLAHELRNPLAPIFHAVELLHRLPLEPREPAGKLLAVMSRQMRQMRRLLDDLLDVARIAQGKIHLKKERFALADAIEGAIDTARPLIDEKRHQLNVRGIDQAGEMVGDSERVTQALGNLLLNAAKYSEPGAVITLDVIPDGSRVSLAVRDTGLGIAGSQLESIFGLFSQVDSALPHARGGLGVGLALAKTLVDLHGGSLTAHSAGVGAGSTFTMMLPRGAHAPARTATAALRTQSAGPKAAAPVRQPFVLVVEDNDDGAQTLAALLRTLGAQVATARSGEEALKLVADGAHPDIALVDLGLPGMDGYALARQLRLGLGSDCVLVALTGFGAELDKRRARQAGLDRHWVKPVTAESLEELLAGAAAAPH